MICAAAASQKQGASTMASRPGADRVECASSAPSIGSFGDRQPAKRSPTKRAARLLSPACCKDDGRANSKPGPRALHRRPLLPLLAVAPRGFRLVAPRYRPHSHEPIAHTGALGFRVEARRADRFPAIEYDRAPGIRGLDSKADNVSPSALVANWRDHSPDLEPRRQLTSRSCGFT